MKNILITGGAGFIGSHLVKRLIEKHYRITVLDNLSKQIHGNQPEDHSPLFLDIKDKVLFIKGSVTNPEDWKYAINNNEIIVHLAAETGTGQSMYEVNRYFETNVQGTALMLDILANSEHNIKKIILSSSRAVYGEGKYHSEEFGIVYPEQRTSEFLGQGNFEVKYPGCKKPLKSLPTDESSKLHPTSIYGITKQTQEQIIMMVCPSIGITPVSFRYQNVYGPGQSLSNPYTGILSIFSNRILNNKEINIFEDGKETRDFIFIEDVINATVLGIESLAANNEVFNVGTGIPIDVLTVAKTLCEKYQNHVPLRISGNYRLGDIRHNFADISKIKSLLNFLPKVSFSDGIGLFTDWVQCQKKANDSYDFSLEELKKRGLFK